MQDERREHLLLVTDAMLQAWGDWGDDGTALTMTTAFSDAVVDCLVVWSEGTIPGDLRNLAGEMDTVREKWNDWVRLHEENPLKNTLPGNALWKALEAVEKGRQEAVTPREFTLEPIASLDAMNPRPTDAQICRMYGFTSDGTFKGQPKITMLYEERAAPGRHTGAGTGWMPPHARRHAQVQQEQAEAVERQRTRRQSKIDALTKPAKESIEELVEVNGISGKQIARMKKIDRAEFEAYCRTHGLQVPPWDSASANAIQGIHDPDEAATVPTATVGRPSGLDAIPGPTVIDEGEGPLTMEQEIIQYHKAGGIGAQEIAEAVSRPDEPVSRQKVQAIIKRWQEDPAAFGAVEV
jgi:hypothetical protein